MKKIYLTLAVVTCALSYSCSNDAIGENPESPQQGTKNTITFGSNFQAVTRAGEKTNGDAANLLGNQMKIYGVKKATSATEWSNVFMNYLIWWDNTANGWEYIGEAGTHEGVSHGKQTVKYWDNGTDNYHFVAGSPYANFTFTMDGTTKDIKTATVTGIAGHINANPGTSGTTTYNPVFIADPVNVPKVNYKKEVQFRFTRQQSYVRVGFYETIPGYSITDIKFYTYGNDSWSASPATSSNIVLASTEANYFTGATNAKATITYNWTVPSYTYEYVTGDTEHALTQAKNWYGGLLTGVPATSSTEGTIANRYGTDKDMDTNGYFTVLPSAVATAQPILVKCDYVLTAEDGSNETITVTGATAAIPAAFSKWNPNTSYTYLFKITDNDLSPITFDAVVVDTEEQGIITTVSTPSISTYQEGSVTADGIKYKYDSSNPKPIYFTAQNNETGALYTLTTGGNAVSNVQVYKLSGEKTEADLIVAAPTTTVTTTIVSAATTVGSWKIPAGSASFTPDAAGYYAIQYQTATSPAAYAYKVVHVE